MSLATAQEIRVSVDVGCHRHSVAIGLSTGQLLDEFDILHKPSGFENFFKRIEHGFYPDSTDSLVKCNFICSLANNTASRLNSTEYFLRLTMTHLLGHYQPF